MPQPRPRLPATPAANGHRDSAPALYWSSAQCAEAIGYSGEALDYPVLFDERMSATSCR